MRAKMVTCDGQRCLYVLHVVLWYYDGLQDWCFGLVGKGTQESRKAVQ